MKRIVLIGLSFILAFGNCKVLMDAGFNCSITTIHTNSVKNYNLAEDLKRREDSKSTKKNYRTSNPSNDIASLPCHQSKNAEDASASDQKSDCSCDQERLEFTKANLDVTKDIQFNKHFPNFLLGLQIAFEASKISRPPDDRHELTHLLNSVLYKITTTHLVI